MNSIRQQGDAAGPATDPRLNPYPHYAKMRAESPIVLDPRFKVWMVYGYQDVHDVLSDHASFSSAQLSEPSIFARDPPQHTQQRKRISKAFTSERVALMESRIRGIADDLLDRVADSGRMDLIADFALPLPITVICDLLGAPMEDAGLFKRWSDDLIVFIEASLHGTQPEAGVVDSRQEFGQYMEALVEQRRREPRDDLITVLAGDDEEAPALSMLDIVATCRTLLVAGHETTTNLIGNTIWTLFEHPDAWARLKAQPQMLPTVIEEVLRYRTPVQFSGRTAKKDVELGGKLIRAGERLIVFTGSANRDPGVFAQPDRFDMERRPNRHLGFGYGIHFCLGALLARMESRVALGALLERLPDLRLEEGAVFEAVPSSLVFGLARLPVRF